MDKQMILARAKEYPFWTRIPLACFAAFSLYLPFLLHVHHLRVGDIDASNTIAIVAISSAFLFRIKGRIYWLLFGVALGTGLCGLIK